MVEFKRRMEKSAEKSKTIRYKGIGKVLGDLRMVRRKKKYNNSWKERVWFNEQQIELCAERSRQTMKEKGSKDKKRTKRIETCCKC